MYVCKTTKASLRVCSLGHDLHGLWDEGGSLFTFSKGENDIDQLCCVLRVLGTPNETIWPVRTTFKNQAAVCFHHEFPSFVLCFLSL